MYDVWCNSRSFRSAANRFQQIDNKDKRIDSAFWCFSSIFQKQKSTKLHIKHLWFPIRIDMRAASVWLCDLTSFIICETISAEFSIEWVVIRSIAFIHITHIHSFKVPLNRKRFAIEAVNMSNEMSLKLQTTNRKWFKHTHSHTNIYKYRISHMRLIKVKFTNFISRCNAFIG